MDTSRVDAKYPHLCTLLNTIQTNWKDIIKCEIDLEGQYSQKILKEKYLIQLDTFLRENVFKQFQTIEEVIYPHAQLIFNVFNYSNFENIKCVIIGQDPYINTGEAMGLSFSVPQGIKIPPSLMTIIKELQNDKDVAFDEDKKPQNGDLTPWARQGVLLLNMGLTVFHGKSESHLAIWKQFTQMIIKKINDFNQGVLFCLWGNKSQLIDRLVDKSKHYVLKAGHPSPLNRTHPFVGCRVFGTVNRFLVASGRSTINWNFG
jgi:uracil-DNA glycosylase